MKKIALVFSAVVISVIIGVLVRRTIFPSKFSMSFEISTAGDFYALVVGEADTLIKSEILADTTGAIFSAPAVEKQNGIFLHDLGDRIVLQGMRPGNWPLVAENASGLDRVFIHVK